jgi:hypothetical protein
VVVQRVKRIELGRLPNGYQLAMRIDGIVFAIEMPTPVVEARGLMACCRHARALIAEMALQRRLMLLNGPSPSRWVH